MKKSINDNQKRRGRPATGTAPLVGVRMTLEFQRPIKAWAKSQEDRPSMAEAIRRLVELGLKVKLEGMIDPAAPPEERAQRRRRLTKGPLEFREDRVDLPKAKGK
jgi:hypothetical protein